MSKDLSSSNTSAELSNSEDAESVIEHPIDSTSNIRNPLDLIKEIYFLKLIAYSLLISALSGSVLIIINVLFTEFSYSFISIFFALLLFSSIYKENLLVNILLNSNKIAKRELAYFLVYCAIVFGVIMTATQFKWYSYGLEFFLGFGIYYFLVYLMASKGSKEGDYSDFFKIYLAPQLSSVVINSLYSFIILPFYFTLNDTEKIFTRIFLHPILIGCKMFCYIVFVGKYNPTKVNIHDIQYAIFMPYVVNSFFGRIMLFLIGNESLIYATVPIVEIFLVIQRLSRRKVGMIMYQLVYDKDQMIDRYEKEGEFIDTCFTDQMRMKFIAEIAGIILSSILISISSDKLFVLSVKISPINVFLLVLYQVIFQIFSYISISYVELKYDNLNFFEGMIISRKYVYFILYTVISVSMFMLYSYRTWSITLFD